MKSLLRLTRIVGLLTFPAFVAACASNPPAAQVDGLLTAAGFKTVVASTDRQLKHIPTLPPGQVTVISDTGKNWFIYPDLAKNRVYVGTQNEYRAYLKLRMQNGLPDVDPQASYYRQDTAMTATTARYAGIPYDGWPEFAVMTFP